MVAWTVEGAGVKVAVSMIGESVAPICAGLVEGSVLFGGVKVGRRLADSAPAGEGFSGVWEGAKNRDRTIPPPTRITRQSITPNIPNTAACEGFTPRIVRFREGLWFILSPD
jgi:hypothetical protein